MFKNLILPIVGQVPPPPIDKRSSFTSVDWSETNTTSVPTADEGPTETVRSPKKEGIMKHIRLSIDVTLEAMSQTNVMVVTDQAGLIVIEPQLEGTTPQKFRAADGVSEV